VRYISVSQASLQLVPFLVAPVPKKMLKSGWYTDFAHPPPDPHGDVKGKVKKIKTRLFNEVAFLIDF